MNRTRARATGTEGVGTDTKSTPPRSILLKAWEVRGLLEGTKTAIRRPVDVPPWAEGFDVKSIDGLTWLEVSGRHPELGGCARALWCPWGRAGDILVGKETWMDFCPAWDGSWCGCGSQEMRAERHKVAYRATGTGINHKDKVNVLPFKWHSATTMPLWASRLRLVLTDQVSVGRLLDVTQEEAKREGLEPLPGTYTADFALHGYAEALVAQWDRDYGKRHPASGSPWCWRAGVRVVQGQEGEG